MIAEELANEHCGYYKGKSTKVVTAFFRNQPYRTWGLTAHRGWTRLLLDRRCLVQIPNSPRHHTKRSRVRDDDDEHTTFDSYMNPEAGFHNGPGFQGPLAAPCARALSCIVSKKVSPSGGGGKLTICRNDPA